jgi:hypothetical protein
MVTHEHVRRLRPELWRQKNWLLHHDNAPSHTFFFTKEFFTKNNITVVPHSPYSHDLGPCDFYLFPWLLIGLKGSRFDATDVIEAGSQAVLGTLTEHDSQDAFKKWKKRWEPYIYICERELLRAWWGPVGPKLVFDKMAASVPDIMDTSGIFIS